VIDTKTGHIRINDSIELNSQTKFESTKDLNLGQIQKVSDMKNGYKWIYIKNLKVDQKYFVISLCFYRELLESILFIPQDHAFDLDSTGNFFNMDDEQEKLKRFNTWLTSEIGDQRKFNWGEVWTEYDPKGGFSSIGLRYEKKQSTTIASKHSPAKPSALG
jgi:hypothetical protein